jgi:3-oxoacyl-[acyl-carrier protein] reductase
MADKTALVTGASRGIGRGIACALGHAGWNVVVNYAGNRVAAEEVVTIITGAGRRAVAVQADIGSGDDRQRLLDAAVSHFGRIDLLVNNAGVAPTTRADILAAGEESFDRLIRINLKGPYFLTQLVANHMLSTAESSPGPTGARPAIVTISSISAYTASPDRGDYCIAKAGLSMMTQLFAVRLAEAGIGVYEIRPGIIATDMTGSVRDKYDKLIAQGLTPIRRWGTPEDVAAAVLAIADGRLPFSTGEVINVDGGFHLRQL